MIRPTEALVLAATKLKMRKIRLIITVIITSLLFAVLIFLASITEGSISSIQSFNKEGYGNRYLVQATPTTHSFGAGTDKEMTDALMPVQRDLVARKKAAAKRLGLQYDETSDRTLPLLAMKNGTAPTEYYPNYESKFIADYLNDKNQKIPGTDYASFQQTANKAGATETYQGTAPGAMFGPGVVQGGVQVMVDGTEDFARIGARNNGSGMYGPPDTSGVASITSLGWSNTDPELLRPFVLPGQSMTTGKDGSIPVIAPFSAAEEIVGLKALPSTADSEQKLARLSEVRSSVAAKTAQLCYRNSASTDLLSQAIEQQKEIEAKKNDKTYTAPALHYQLPATPCGPVTVKSDKRSADEKKEAANQKAFDTEFGQASEPEQGVLIIRIVGVGPDVDYGSSISATSVLTSLLSSSIGSGWISPAPPVEQNRLASVVQGGTATTADRTKLQYYAEFPTLAAMEAFIKAQTCESADMVKGPDGRMYPTGMGDPALMIAGCIQQGKVLSVAPYGNSAGAIEQFRSGIWKFARYAVLAVVAMAALIMMGNVGKIIADSRRETAVFRSLGAKRFDIAQIYLTYTVLIGLLIAAAAIVVGSLVAVWLSNKYSPDLSVAAVLAYNAQDVDKQFSLFGFNSLYVLAVTGLIVLAGLLSASLPLLTNTRRSPIRDMRDDS